VNTESAGCPRFLLKASDNLGKLFLCPAISKAETNIVSGACPNLWKEEGRYGIVASAGRYCMMWRGRGRRTGICRVGMVM
jgi:hypothetical protein